jgi:hypothetical protein
MSGPVESLVIAAIGLTAGLVGGLTGLGGSVVMLPALAFVLGFADDSHTEQHVYMTAAIAINFLVAVPATFRHARAGAVDAHIIRRLIPTAAACMVGGVTLSNAIDPTVLIKALAATIAVFVALGELGEHLGPRSHDEPIASLARRKTATIMSIGVATGLLAGLLGIGGGVIMVAALRALARFPVRTAIAASAATMCVMAPIGCITKAISLPALGLDPLDAGRLVLLMGPTAVIGSMLGSTLVHRLHRTAVRWTVSTILLIAAAKLGGLW